MAIVDRMSRLLGHKVEVRSKPEAGSVFSVLLPIDTIDETTMDNVPPLPLFELDGKRILILDDDAEVVEATKTLLSRWGADAAGAHTSDEALHLATSGDRPPDLVIVDYVLADGETGTGVIRRIDEALGTRIPRIVISGDLSSDVHSEARRVGSVLLHKPVDPAKLRSLIHHLLVSAG